MTTMRMIPSKISCLPVKWADGYPRPNFSAGCQTMMSILLCSHILAAFRGVDTFDQRDHLSSSRSKTELKLRNHAGYETEGPISDLEASLGDNRRTILRGQETGQWLPVLPSITSTARNSPPRVPQTLSLFYGMLGVSPDFITP
jgi:hypothetical protein